MSRGRRSIGAACITALCVLAAAPAGAAASNSPQSPAEPPCIVDPASSECVLVEGAPEGWSPQLQDELASFTGDIRAKIGGHPGFADIGVDFGDRSIQVYFHGQMPQSIDAVQQAALAADISIEQVEVASGAARLERNTLRLAEQLTKAQVSWSTIAPDAAYGALVVSGPGLGEEVALQSRVATAAKLAVVDVPVTTASAPAVVASDDRTSDLSPFTGGARLHIDQPGTLNDSVCTAGFSMRSTDGYNYMLTAAHCALYANGTIIHNGQFFGGAGNLIRQIGTSSWTSALQDQNQLDATLLRIPSSSQNAPSMFHGAWDTATERTVTAWEPMDMGMIGCVSGATSGLKCGVARASSATALASYDGRYHWVFQIYDYVNGSDRAVIAGGDSGGPVYRIKADGTLSAYGIVGAGQHFAACDPPMNPDTGQSCYRIGFVTPINRIVGVLGGYGASSVFLKMG